MAFSGSHIEITLRYTNLSQQCQTARVYTWDGAAIAAASAVQVAEAWWNHYKAAWRALVGGGASNGQFLSVLVREIGGSLSFGEWAVPTGEQAGTRTGLTAANMPSFTSVGVRLTVGSLVTRPGQMRVPFMNEEDSVANAVQPTFIGLVEDLATLYSEPNILGAPVATGVITPVVVHYDPDTGAFVGSQPIEGFIVNPFTTTQVSRRYGHGN